MSQDKTKRRCFRYSLRTLFVFMAVCSALFSWLGVKVRQAQRQQEAVEAIREFHWDLRYDYEFGPNSTRLVSPKLPGPGWVRNSFGIDLLADVVYLDFRGDGVTNAGLDYLEGLNQLKYLHLKNASMTDAGLVRIEGLIHLESLTLSQTPITDAGLVYLKGLTHLRCLHLEKTQITDAGVVNLKDLTRLEELDLNGTQITDAGLMHLRGLTKLKSIDLRFTLVTDAGAEELRDTLPNLVLLYH